MTSGVRRGLPVAPGSEVWFDDGAPARRDLSAAGLRATRPR